MNDRERILRESLADWRAQGLLSGEQHDRLLASVVAPRASPGALAQERKLGRGVAILINLGALVLAAGLLVFFASNWIEFGRAAKIASLFGLTLFFYLAGFELGQEGRWRFPALGVALVFLGCAMFGVDVVLLALIYDLTAEHAWSLLLDWAVWLSVAYLMRSRLILFLGLAGVTAWFGAEIGYSWGGYWLYLGRPFHFVALGACLLAVAGLHAWRGQRGFAASYALVGLLLVYLSTLILSIFDLQRSVRVDPSTAPAVVWLLLAGPFVFALAALAAIHLGWRRAALTDPPVLVVLLLVVLLVLGSVIAATPEPRQVWFILLLTLLTAAGVYLGIAWESPVFLNTGLVFFAVNVYTRFYEYFWDAMPKSLFFIVGGSTLILGGVWVERTRRRLLRRFGADAG
ncbi:MAG: hypothetical protein A3I14_16580 [Candidatus Rokubacteria bacterium RIFCSPLOWO2_02_FULL_73_56]|nr:MAG: hypothetical protein A3D33_22155 [Candidatus Rokubacteria bacterium RIFCSPHIGHO2_02_FULL_73_26]OGL13155.1 MAG: hypothetical protein A3I14_16580 [Candidatus Rokubacteria bacterium RIFCSPLOWO2_02_FULL_73_56]OGL28718.1 MAG: hypothetical protein A3G44_12250 [Candidatus Rokubacteria bacterium RIFCSPLOWO2_12_FULL_73_47]